MAMPPSSSSARKATSTKPASNSAWRHHSILAGCSQIPGSMRVAFLSNPRQTGWTAPQHALHEQRYDGPTATIGDADAKPHVADDHPPARPDA
jgi:hypothetical protein